MNILQKTGLLRLMVAITLALLVAACGGAEDGDLAPPDFTFDGGLPVSTASTGPFTLTGTVAPPNETDAEFDVTIINSGDGGTWTLDSFLDGDWSITVDGLDEGLNQIIVEISDPIGNSNILNLAVTVDQTPPTVTIDQYTTPTPDSVQTLAGTISDLDGDVEISIDGAPFVQIPGADISSGIWKYQVNLASNPGVPYLIKLRGTDSLGNTQTDPLDYTTASIEVDVAANVFTIAEDDSGPIYLPDPMNDSTLQLNGARTDSYSVGITEMSPTSSLAIDNTTSTVNWSADFAGLPAGITRVTFGLNDLTPTEISQAKVLIVNDLIGPDLLQVVPAHGDSVPASTDVTLTFSEDIAPFVNDGNNGTLLELEAEDGTIITFTTDPASSGNRTFVFTPDVATPIQGATEYTLKFVSTDPLSVTDVYGNEFIRPTGLLKFTTQ